MARPRKYDSPQARLEALREAKARRNAPTCHPDRVQLGKTGLCHECYVGTNAAKSLGLQDALRLAEKHADPGVALTLRNQALALLMENLPEYARLHVEAAKIAAVKGDAKPAEWALTMIKNHGQPAVVDLPKNTPVDSGVKILIGVRLGGLDKQLPASNEVDAEVVCNSESTG